MPITATAAMTSTQSLKHITGATCEDAAVATLRSVAHMIAERHGDDVPAVEELCDVAAHIEEGRRPKAIDRLEDLARGAGISVASPAYKAALRDTARVALIMLDGCD